MTSPDAAIRPVVACFIIGLRKGCDCGGVARHLASTEDSIDDTHLQCRVDEDYIIIVITHI